MNTLRLFLLGLLFSMALQARGDGKLALAGAEYGGDNGYYYAGLLAPLPGSDLGNGFVQRYWVDWLRYEYDNGNRTITAKAPGAAAALGYARSTGQGSFSVYAGPVYRHTELSPDDRNSDVRGAQWGMNLSLQGEHRLDIGNFLSYHQAFLEVSLSDPEHGPALRAWARAYLRESRRRR